MRRSHRLALLALIAFAPKLFADELRVKIDKAPVFSGPAESSKVVGHLPKEKSVQTLSQGGTFVRLRSRSGKSLWMRASDVAPVPDPDPYEIQRDVPSDLYGPQPPFKRILLDVGGAGGSASGQSFAEGAVGLEYFMMESLSWRNAVFYRFAGVLQDSYGLDSSIRGNGDVKLGSLALRGIIGGGFRFSSQAGGSAPFAEAGGFATLGGFDFGMMGKYLIHSASDPSRSGVFIYSLVFSGSAGFF